MGLPGKLFSRVDQGFYENKKIASLDPIAREVLLKMILYSGRALTDGFVPANIATELANMEPLKELLSSLIGRRPMAKIAKWLASGAVLDRIWQASGVEVVPGGYQIHDYLDWQRSAEDVRKRREKDAIRQRNLRAKLAAEEQMSRRDSRVTHGAQKKKKKNSETAGQAIQKIEEEEETTTERRSDSGGPSDPVRIASCSSSSFSVEMTERQNEPEIATRSETEPWASGPVVTMSDLLDWQRARQWGRAHVRQLTLAQGLLYERPIDEPERVKVERQTEKEGTPTLGLAISILSRLRTQEENNTERRRRGLAPVGRDYPVRVNLPSAAEEASRAAIQPLTDAEHEASMSSLQECISSLEGNWAVGG
jgi:hypothetical protein